MFKAIKFFLKNKLRIRHKIIIWATIIIVVLYYLTKFFDCYINPVIITTSESKVSAVANIAVNQAISNVLATNNAYQELVNVEYNGTNQVVLIQANGLAINALGNKLAKETQGNLDRVGQQTVAIPLGNFTGMPIFAGQGPLINIKLLPIGTVTCKFKSEFVKAGINQTNHKIYLTAETRTSLVMPLANKFISTQTEVLICENIIVGNVPETYLNATEVDSLLNLI